MNVPRLARSALDGNWSANLGACLCECEWLFWGGDFALFSSILRYFALFCATLCYFASRHKRQAPPLEASSSQEARGRPRPPLHDEIAAHWGLVGAWGLATVSGCPQDSVGVSASSVRLAGSSWRLLRRHLLRWFSEEACGQVAFETQRGALATKLQQNLGGAPAAKPHLWQHESQNRLAPR